MKKDNLPNLHLYLVSTALPDKPYCTYFVCAEDDDEAKDLVEAQADDEEQLVEARMMHPVHPGIIGWLPINPRPEQKDNKEKEIDFCLRAQKILREEWRQKK